MGTSRISAPGLGEALDHVAGPDVLADRKAEADAAEIHRPGQRPGRENALLVEDAVIRQVDLEAHRDRAAVEQRIGVVELALLPPGQPDEHAGPAIGRLAGEALERGAAGILEGRLQHEVLGRIAGEEQLGEHHDVGAEPGRLRAGLASLLLVAGHVADDGVELSESDLENVLSHGTGI